MALERITDVSGKGVFLPGNDIDTDRIIPARFMVCVTFEGLGKYAFYDERKNADGSDKVHPLTDPRKQNAKILLSGAKPSVAAFAAARPAASLSVPINMLTCGESAALSMVTILTPLWAAVSSTTEDFS